MLCSTTAFAQTTYTWIGGSGNSWQNSNNWSPNGYPGAGDNAQFTSMSGSGTIGPLTSIPSGIGTVKLISGFTGTVQIGADLICGDLDISTGTLQINSGFDLTVTNTTTINGGTLTLNDPSNQHSLGVFALSSGTFNGAGTVQMTSATISGGTFYGNDGTYQTTSGGITVSGGTFYGNDGTYQTTSGGITVSGGTFNGNNGDYTINQNQQLAISGGTFNAGSGSYDLSISSNNTVFNHTLGTFNRGTSTFTVNVGSGTATLSTNTTTGFHNLTITSNSSSGAKTVNFAGGGTFTIHNELKRTGRLTNVTGSNLQYASGATLRYNPIYITNQNVFGEWPASGGPTNVIKQGTNIITLTDSRTIPSGGFLEVDGGGFTIGGTSPITLTIALGAEARLTSGTLTVNSGRTLAVDGALRRNGGSLTNNGTLTYGTTGTQTVFGETYTGAVLWYSASGTTLIGSEFPTSVPNLLLTTSGTVSGSGNRTVQGRLVISSGTINLSSSTLTALGEVRGGAATQSTIADATTLNVGGGLSTTSAQAITGGGLTLNKLIIDKKNVPAVPWNPDNVVTVAFTSLNFTTGGSLSIQYGTLAFTSPTLIGSLSNLSLNITADAILKTGGAAVHNIGGPFTVNGKIVFNGTNPEVLPPNRIIARIEINNSNNVYVSNLLYNTVTVTDSLIFTLGNITQTNASNYLFVLQSACIVSGSGYVDGPVRRVFPTTGTGDGIVPIGGSAGSPSANWITLNFSSGSGSAILRFEQINGNIGGPPSGSGWSARSTTRYWKIDVVSGSITSPIYSITVQKANSGIATPKGRILRYISLMPVTPEATYLGGQTDNGTEVTTPNAMPNAYTNFQPAFTIVRDNANELIWGGGQPPSPNSWNQADNWWVSSTGLRSTTVPGPTNSVVIDGERLTNIGMVTGPATVVLSGTAGVCEALSVGINASTTNTSTLQIQTGLSVGSGYQPANTAFLQNSTIVWQDGSGGVQADDYRNLTVNNSSALGTQGTGSITVSGNMVKQGIGTFTPLSGNAITVSGNYTNTAGDANYSNASLNLNMGGTTFTLNSGTVSGNIALFAQNIQLYGGTMSANLTINGTGTQTISGTGTTSLAGLTVTNGIEVDLGGETRTVVGNVALNNLAGKITNGTLRMAGTSAQSIGGTSSVSTVANLQIDNSSGVTLNRPLRLTGTLTMTNGNLNTTATNILTATATSGGSASSFVNGPLQIGQVQTATASYPKNYPVGDGSVYRPFQITTGPNANTVQRVRLVNSSPLSAGATPGGGLSAISAFRYWELTNDDGTAAGTQAGDQVVLGYVLNPVDDGINNLSPYPLRAAARSAPLAGAFSPFGGVDIPSFLGVRGVQSNTSLTTGLRFYTLGSVNASDAPLPVELISFAITAVDEGVKLKWETASEVENAGFILSRSRFRDGGFEELASYRTHEALVGKGTSATGGKYEWIDKSKLLPGETYYYKLEDVDFNGVIHTAEVKEFTMPKEYSLSQNYPNPFNSSTVVEFNLRMPGRTVLEVYNVLGQRVMTVVDGELSAGSYRYQVNLSGLASGMYLYRLRSRDFVATKKMLLIK
jgi:hypothetical protein